MKVTALHMANKVEEAARSYFSNSLIFASQKIEAERMIDFRRGKVALQFAIRRGEDDLTQMGGLEFETVAERDERVAFQCRYTIQPSGESKQFFLMVRSDREPYSQYMRIVDMLRKPWEKQMDAYLAPDEDGNVTLPEAPSADDEYEGLTPEEIEAVTGVRPGAKPEPAASEDFGGNLSADEIQRLMGMGVGGDEEAAPEADGSQMMSLEEIEALTREAQNEETEHSGDFQAAPKKSSSGPGQDDEVEELSAEDIWKQITGGGNPTAE